MSLLSICNTVAAEIGLPQYGSIVGNSDIQATQFYALAQRAGAELAEDGLQDGYWQQLRVQYVFTTTGVGPYTCTITPGSNVLTNLSSTTGILNGYQAYASGLVNDSIVTNVNAGAQTVTVSQIPTSTVGVSGENVTFAQEAYNLPSDFKYFVEQTTWDRNFRWQLLGPIDAQEWQVIKSGISPVGPRMRFRIFNGQFNINPVGSATSVYTDSIVYEYASAWWVAAAGSPGVRAQATWLTDQDTSIIDEDLITLSLKWRMLRAKGLDFGAELEQFENRLARVKARSRNSRNLPLNARASGIRLLNSQNVPDTGFGS